MNKQELNKIRKYVQNKLNEGRITNIESIHSYTDFDEIIRILILSREEKLYYMTFTESDYKEKGSKLLDEPIEKVNKLIKEDK